MVLPIDAAKEIIIRERRTPIGSLVARLQEDRVRRILAPMLLGGYAEADLFDDGFAYVAGLGLFANEPLGHLLPDGGQHAA